MLITFEGIEASGKSTQQELLKNYLISKHPSKGVVCTREPGGTEIGVAIRDRLLNSTDRSVNDLIPAGTLTWLEGLVSPLLEDHVFSDIEQPIADKLKLFLFDRALHIQEVIIPALQMGYIVLCDRFTDSTVAYQGHGKGFPVALIHKLNRVVTFGVAPTLTFFLDISPEESMKRVATRNGKGDQFEQESLDFHERVMTGYLDLLYGGNKIAIDGTAPTSVIHSEIRQHVEVAMMVLDRQVS